MNHWSIRRNARYNPSSTEVHNVVLYYCEKCGTRVDPEDLQTGTARLMDESRAICLACCSQERSALPSSSSFEASTIGMMRDGDPRPESQTRQLPRNAAASTQKAHAVGGSAVHRATAPASARMPASKIASTVEAPSAAPSKWLAFALGAGVVLLGVSIALLRPTGGSDEPKTALVAEKETPQVETASKTPAPDPPRPTPPPEHLDARGKEAHRLLEEARIFALKNPTESHAYAAKLEQIFNAFRATPAGQEAQVLLRKMQHPDPQTQLAPESAWSSAINLTALIDTGKDVVKGKWKKEGSKLIVEPEALARIHIPFEPPEEYDFRIVFSRVSGEEDVNMMFAAYGKALMWSMSPAKNTCMGFECINAKAVSVNSHAVVIKPALDNDKLYTCVVQVRNGVLRAYLNGKIVKEYRTSYNEFSMRNDWKLKNERLLGLGGHNSRIVFDRVELRPVTGSGKTIR
jgi:hypothetical protein